MTNWERYGPDQYAWWRQNYDGLYKFIRAFIADQNIRSILEIGGGDGYVGRWCPGEYVNIDSNPLIVEYAQHQGAKALCADWRTLDIQSIEWTAGHFDLVLACNVVEHWACCFDALDKMLALKPRWLLLSFFLGLSDELIDRKVHRRGVTMTQYSWPLMCMHLESRKLQNNWHRIGVPHPPYFNRNDEVLLLECQEVSVGA